MKLTEIINNYPDIEFIKIESYDKAVIGMTTDFRLVYCVSDIIQILVDNGMELDNAIEHFEFNINHNFDIENAPILIYTDFF